MKRLAPLAFAALVLPAHAGVICAFIPTAVPALDDVGLIVLAVLVGGVAGWAAKRRR
jgi:hypothetical protein